MSPRTNGRWVDLDTWYRRDHYDLFRAYDQPFFGVCTDVRVTGLYARAHTAGGPSFFLATLHASLGASNAIEEFRLRLRPGGVWMHDRIHGGSTVLRHDDTFGFAYFDYEPSWYEFEAAGRAEIERVSAAIGSLDAQDERDDLVHHSVLPWIRFTAFAPARRHHRLDSIPKVVFGQHFERDGERRLPVALDVHHALVDGIHVGRWLEAFEARLQVVGSEPTSRPR